MRRSLPAACVAVALACLLPAAAAAATTVKVLGGFFEPGSIEVAPGDEVTWLSEDAMPHTVTSSWDSGATFDETVKQGDAFAYTFAEPGTYTVHCKPHAYYDDEAGEWTGMVMQVTVAEAAPAPTLDPGAGIGGGLKGTPGIGVGLALVACGVIALVVARRRA